MDLQRKATYGVGDVGVVVSGLRLEILAVLIMTVIRTDISIAIMISNDFKH